jgi:cell division septum initiation protein DivIVA
MVSRIEQIIEEIEEYIGNCKYQSFSNTKIIVNKEEIEELLTELRMKTPDEIKRYQKIISNKEAILADAQKKAETIIAKAEVHNTELVSEHQIMQQAYAQANEVVMLATREAQEILDNATNDANDIRMGAMQYTDGILKNLESIIGHAMETTKERSEGLITSLQECFQVVAENRKELGPQPDYSVDLEEDTAEEETPKQLDADMLN